MFYNGRRMKEYPFLSWVSSFTGRAVVFFFSSSALLFFFYLLGNYQDFLDSTQRLILSALHLSLVLELVCGMYLVAFLVLKNIRERRAFIVRWILLILSMIVCGSLLLMLRYIQSWLQA